MLKCFSLFCDEAGRILTRGVARWVPLHKAYKMRLWGPRGKLTACIWLDILLILQILHDLSILKHHYSQGLTYLGSCRISIIHRIVLYVN